MRNQCIKNASWGDPVLPLIRLHCRCYSTAVRFKTMLICWRNRVYSEGKAALVPSGVQIKQKVYGANICASAWLLIILVIIPLIELAFPLFAFLLFAATFLTQNNNPGCVCYCVSKETKKKNHTHTQHFTLSDFGWRSFHCSGSSKVFQQTKAFLLVKNKWHGGTFLPAHMAQFYLQFTQYIYICYWK